MLLSYCLSFSIDEGSENQFHVRPLIYLSMTMFVSNSCHICSASMSLALTKPFHEESMQCISYVVLNSLSGNIPAEPINA